MPTRFRVIYLLFVYFGIRVFSFFFQPATPLSSNANLLNSFLTLAIVAATAYLFYKKNILGWYVVAGEIILGGTGNFIQVFGITLRSLLLIMSLTIYFYRNYRTVFSLRNDQLIIGEMLFIAALGLLRGWYFSNMHSIIISDAIPYLFLLFYFPLRDLLKSDSWRKFCYTALQAAILGSAIFMLIAYFSFASGLFQVQDAFYHWYRDVAGGKITPIGFNFFRFVLNEQLLLIPILLYFLSGVMAEKGRVALTLATSILLLFVLSLNLTRIYLIALVVGILVLFTRNNWKRWLAVSVGSLAVFLTIFSSLFFIASGGRSLGLEFFGLRLQSVIDPNLEESSFSRMLLLPKILEQIIQHPLLGRGLGSTVAIFSPVENRIITTSHYDWGYLEILAELGIIGFSIWVLFLIKIASRLKNLPRWQSAAFVSLLVINITSPAVSHVLGLILLTLLFALGSNASSEQSVELSRTPELL